MPRKKKYRVETIDDECYDTKEHKLLYQVHWIGYNKPTWEDIDTVKHLDVYRIYINNHPKKKWKKGQKCLFKVQTGYSKKSISKKGKPKYSWLDAKILSCNRQKRILNFEYYHNDQIKTIENMAFGSSAIKSITKTKKLSSKRKLSEIANTDKNESQIPSKRRRRLKKRKTEENEKDSSSQIETVEPKQKIKRRGRRRPRKNKIKLQKNDDDNDLDNEDDDVVNISNIIPFPH